VRQLVTALVWGGADGVFESNPNPYKEFQKCPPGSRRRQHGLFSRHHL